MNTEDLRKELHELAERNRDAAQALSVLHSLGLQGLCFLIPSEYYRQIHEWHHKQFTLARKLDDIADNGSDRQVLLSVRIERKRLGEGKALTVAQRESMMRLRVGASAA